MACKWFDEEYEDCTIIGPDHLCDQWIKWDNNERTVWDRADTFCRDEKYADRWGK